MKKEIRVDLWLDGRTEVATLLERLKTLCGTLGEEPPSLRDLESRFRDYDPFRIVFLGQFNTGKSALISTVAGIPELAPSSVVACTDAVIEYAYGTQTAYFRRTFDGAASWEPIDRVTFEQETSVLVDEEEDQSKALRGCRPARLFRVEAPSDFLKPMRIVLVDTPGFGEDDDREKVAEHQAEYADAAVVVVSAQNAGSKLDIDLIDRLNDNRVSTLIVVNRADQIGAGRARVLAYLRDKLKSRGMLTTADGILFTSAAGNLGNFGENSQSGDDAGITDLREAIVGEVVRRAARAYLEKAKAAADTLRRVSLEDAEARRLLLETQQVANIERQLGVLRPALSDAKQAARRVVERVAAPTLTVERLERDLYATLAAHVKTLAEGAARHDTVASLPDVKGVAEEMLAWLQRRLSDRTKAWADKEGPRLLREEIEKLIAAATDELRAFDILQGATGRGRSRTAQELIDEYGRRLTGGTIESSASGAAWAGSAAGAAATVGALVAGYLVADGVLFYGLGAFVGMLNPAILVAALVAAVAMLATGGPSIVRKAIASRLVKEAASELEKQRHRVRDHLRINFLAPLHRDMAKALDEVLSEELATNEAIVSRLERDLERAKSGDPDVLGGEVQGAKALTSELELVFDKLDRAVDRMRAALGSE